MTSPLTTRKRRAGFIAVSYTHLDVYKRQNLVLPKRRILEIYLNIAQWGPNGEFGAEAGARFAFGKSARDLTAYQAAELAAILPNPVQRSARTPGMLVRRLAGLYERRADAFGTLDSCVRAP